MKFIKNSFKVYKRDLKNIFKNWVAVVIILGLMILPSLYAWFNIKSSWDPYSNTKGISVAVVNKDKGSSFKEKPIDIGKDIVEKLKNNDKIGWKFVDNKEAEWGVKNGKYYASVTIPEDFSYKIMSVVRDKQEKPSLIYSVNEKTNAVAPKITDKGVTTVQSEVTKNFIETVNGLVLEKINKLGIELEKGKPKLKDLVNMIFYVDNKIPEINKSIEELEKGATTLDGFINKTQKDLPLVEDSLNTALDMTESGRKFLNISKKGILKTAPYIKEDLILSKDINSAAEVLLNEGANLISQGSPKAEDFLLRARDKFGKVYDKSNSILELLNHIDSNNSSMIISKFENDISKIKGRLENKINILDTAIEVIDKGEKPSVDLLNKLKEKSNNIAPILDDIIMNFDSRILPAINNTVDKLSTIADNTVEILNHANDSLPEFKDLLTKGHSGIKKGTAELKILKENLPSIEQSIHEVAGNIKKMDDDAQLNEIIELMKNDARKESEFIANPIDIKENKIFPIPNYGSAMTPFFTTLALWVGALILVSILSVEPHNMKGEKKLSSYEKYFGRYLTFMSIAVFQALIVSLGDIFLLKAYISNKIVFVLFSVFISIIFSMIIYTLVSVFGNVGKAIGVILLVLQISSSGGTFPIELTPPFFQKLNPLLPFTYAIQGMREAVGGIIKSVLVKDIYILCIYFVVSILITLHLKTKLENMNDKFVEKFKESGLAE